MPTDYFQSNINYVEDEDFDNDGNFIHPGKFVVMIQGSFCPHCVNAKPDFQKAADNTPNVEWGTIEIDSKEPKEAALSKRLEKILPFEFRGVPSYILINDGKVMDEYKGDRSTKTLIEFANKL
jgi:thiol-disulfide isomerase/thioredoxin